MNRELLAKLGHIKDRIQRVGARTSNMRRIQKYYLSIRGEVRKAKAQIEFNLTRDVQSNKNHFCWCKEAKGKGFAQQDKCWKRLRC